MTTSKRRYLPAAGWKWLLPIYDPYVRLLGWDAVRRRLLDQIKFEPGHRLLDLGCATGTLVVDVKQSHPDVAVVGLDPDPEALTRAGRKAIRAGVKLHLIRGFSDQLPFVDACFDRVACTGMFSLLSLAEKETTLREVCRVLRPGGSFHLLDVVKMPLGGSLYRRVWRSVRDSQVCTEHQIVALLDQSGLTAARKTGQHPFWLWPVATYRASR